MKITETCGSTLPSKALAKTEALEPGMQKKAREVSERANIYSNGERTLQACLFSAFCLDEVFSAVIATTIA